MGRRLARLSAVVLFVAVALPTARAGGEEQPVRIPVRLESGPAHQSVVVERGDHLWKISERHLDNQLGREAVSDEISPYWIEVIEENRHNLRSGDPDLIYPGELVTLPPVTVNERR